MRLLIAAAALARCASAVTIYTTFTTDSNGQPLQPSNTNTATGPAYTGPTAYNLTTIPPPALPNPLPSLNFAAQLYATGATGLSLPQKGNFVGWSIELSVANQFLGRNSSRLNVPFLNYAANLKARAGGGINVRVGGNSQENTEFFFTPFDNHYEIINKTEVVNQVAPTGTPAINIYIDLLYTLMNITTLTSTSWYLGLPFGYPVNVSGIVEIAQIYEDTLGDNLLALQLGNEPDLFGANNRGRPDAYPIQEYFTEYSNVTSALLADSGLKREKILLTPSTCCESLDNWRITDVLDAGLLTTFSQSISHLAVQRYPLANCPPTAPQATDEWPNYLRHDNFVVDVITRDVIGYGPAAAAAQAAGVPFIMFETNTASCAGFPGISNTFGAALWAIDWSLQLAYRNFTGALYHFGGQDASYNAFTPPPSNYSANFQWTTGPIYYSMLAVTEALGASNVSQVVDLNLNNSPFTPGYGIYENGAPTKVMLINYMDDGGTGTAQYTAYVHIGGTQNIPDTTPQTVQVRYLAAHSVSEMFNITWAGQTMGGQFESDGRLQGNVVTVPVTCSPDTGCPITVPAPGAALVFMTTDAENESFNTALTATYPTTFYSQGGPTVDQSVLETSNGRGGPGEAQVPLGGTSHGETFSGASRVGVSLGLTLGAAAMGAAVIGRMLVGA